MFSGDMHLFKKRRILEWGTCPHCGRENRALRSHSTWQFFHAMFIPLIPMGTIRAVLCCPSCFTFHTFALKGRKLKAAIAEQREEALARVGEDLDTTLQDVAAMAHLGDFEGVESLVEQLSGNGDDGAAVLVEARFLDLQGRAEEAEARFRDALKFDAYPGAPRFWFGRFLLYEGREAEAIAEFQQAAEESPEYPYIDMLVSLIELRRRQKKWDALAAIMGEVLRMDPDLANTKSFSKLFAKAYKKSGRALNVPNPYAQS